MMDSIESGKIRIEINTEKQNRHQFGHKLYEEYKKKNIRKGLKIPCYMLLDNSELDSLIQQKTGKVHLITDKNGKTKKLLILIKLSVKFTLMVNLYQRNMERCTT